MSAALSGRGREDGGGVAGPEHVHVHAGAEHAVEAADLRDGEGRCAGVGGEVGGQADGGVDGQLDIGPHDGLAAFGGDVQGAAEDDFPRRRG